ncbi:hypothetical protein HJG60_008760 [Phyllostomus discolor]|uniref:Uncharacterized protein n=1 Tax=Phyllostomus discolor TaxID=89673 RepID=A0A834DI41_9CHIR|nr:hypothetical protein HJG60_008760 [Phyllostomus discolor]
MSICAFVCVGKRVSVYIGIQGGANVGLQLFMWKITSLISNNTRMNSGFHNCKPTSAPLCVCIHLCVPLLCPGGTETNCELATLSSLLPWLGSTCTGRCGCSVETSLSFPSLSRGALCVCVCVCVCGGFALCGCECLQGYGLCT